MMNRQRYLWTAALVAGVVSVVSWAYPAHADSRMLSKAQMLPAYQQECASCHMAYSPEFLSKPAWNRIMQRLDKHYGTDASLDAATVKKISNWLAQHGGSYKRVTESSPEDRLSTTPWFVRKHREISPSVFQRASIKSAANCTACHMKAEQGNYDEDFVRIPR